MGLSEEERSSIVVRLPTGGIYIIVTEGKSLKTINR